MKPVQIAVVVVEVCVAALLTVVAVQTATTARGHCDDGPTGGTCIATSWWSDAGALALVIGIAITVLALLAHAASTVLRRSNRVTS